MAIFSSPKHAFNNFGMNNTLLTGFKQKFTFFVEFQISQDVSEALSSLGGDENPTNINDYNKGLSFEVKTADRPNLSMEVQTLNEYNRKRVVQQHIEYGDFSINFYDVGLGSKMCKDYLRFYYADFRHNDISAWNDDSLLSDTFNMDTYGFGFQPISNNQYFFDRITLYQLHSYHKYDSYTFVHPKIKSMNFGDSDYSSSEIHTISLNFAYEGLIVKLNETLEAKQNDAFRLKENAPDVELETSAPSGPEARPTPTINGSFHSSTLGNSATTTKDIKKILDLSNSRTTFTTADSQPKRLGSSVLNPSFISNQSTWKNPDADNIPATVQQVPSEDNSIIGFIKGLF